MIHSRIFESTYLYVGIKPLNNNKEEKKPSKAEGEKIIVPTSDSLNNSIPALSVPLTLLIAESPESQSPTLAHDDSRVTAPGGRATKTIFASGHYHQRGRDSP